MEFVDAQPLQFAGEARKQEALARARAELDRIAERWASEATLPAVA
jgi:hypothetical protein